MSREMPIRENTMKENKLNLMQEESKRDTKSSKIHAKHLELEPMHVTMMVSELLSISTMNMISRKINALKIFKKSKKDVRTNEEMPSIEATVDTHLN